MRTTEHCLQVFAGLGALPNGRQACAQLPGTPIGMVTDVVRCLRYQQAPMVMKYALEGAARFCSEATLQYNLLDAGAAWMLVPLLFQFDSTVDAEELDIDTNAQAAANMMAVKAANVLARLTGQHPDFPANPLAIRALGLMLTPALAALLCERDEDVKELLNVLSTSTKTSYRYWSSAMRDELLAFVETRIEASRIADNWSVEPALDFRLEAHTHELVVDNVFVRIYNEKVRGADAFPPPLDLARRHARSLYTVTFHANRAHNLTRSP